MTVAEQLEILQAYARGLIKDLLHTIHEEDGE